MPARIDLPEAEVLEMYRQKPDVFSIAEHFHVSDHPVRRILRNHGAMLTLAESLKASQRAKAAARKRSDENRPQLTGQDAEDYRLDRAWLARHGVADVVYCPECLYAYADLTNDERQVGREDGHIWSAHHMTNEQTKRKWPGMRMTAWKYQVEKNGPTLAELMQMAVEKYLSAPELREHRSNPNYEKERNENYVACRLCGLKAAHSIFQHLRDVHQCSPKEYRKDYPKAPIKTRAYFEKWSSAYCRPADWYDKPIDHRIIANELFSRERYMGNLELAERLLASSLLDLSDYGRTPQEIVKSRGFEMRVNRVRKWINRPGGK